MPAAAHSSEQSEGYSEGFRKGFGHRIKVEAVGFKPDLCTMSLGRAETGVS